MTTKTKGDVIVEKLKALDDNIARPVPIAARHVCTEAAKIIKAIMSSTIEETATTSDTILLGSLFDEVNRPEVEPAKSASADLGETKEEKTSHRGFGFKKEKK